MSTSASEARKDQATDQADAERRKRNADTDESSKTDRDGESGGVPGSDADKPQEIPLKGWVQIAKRGWAEAKIDQVPLLGAGVAFFSFLALFPSIIALVSLYSLFADPAVIAEQVNSLTALPEAVRQLLVEQVQNSNSAALGWSAVISIAIALFSASGGVSNLMTAVNVAYDETDKRNPIRKRLIALGLTVGAIVFLAVMLGLVAVVPPLLDSIFGNGNPVIVFLLQVARWLLLIVLISVALAVLYRVAPDRDAPKMRWVSVGAAVATLLWLLASVGFSIYVSTLGNYAKTYGALAGIVVLLLWLFITSYAVLLGAEINAEAEQQTAADTTKGQEKPMGDRDAVKADSGPGGEAGSGPDAES